MVNANTVFEEVAELERQGDVSHAFLVVNSNEEVEAVSRLSGLTSLKLTYNSSTADFSPLLRLSKLKQLELSVFLRHDAHESPTAGLRVLTSLPELESFKFYYSGPDLMLAKEGTKTSQVVIPPLPYIKHLEVSGNNCQFSLASDFPFSQLQSFDIDAPMVDQSCLSRMPQLKSLSVGKFQTLSPQGVECLAHLKNLERFHGLEFSQLPLNQWKSIKDLGTTDVDGEALKTIAKMREIERLCLGISHSSDNHLTLLASLLNLKSLALDFEFDPGIRALKFAGTGAGLSALSKCSRLEELHLERIPVSESLIAAVSEIRSLRNLSIQWANNFLTPAMARSLNKLTNVEELSVPWPEKGMIECLRECLGLSKIKSLDMHSQLLTDDEAQVLTNFPHLEYLNLRGNALSDGSVSSLAELSRLVSLSLDGNPIQGYAIERLVALPSLKELGLGATRITDAVLENKHPISDSLEQLDLQGNEIAGPGLMALSGLSCLKELNIGSTRITDAGLQYIRSESLETINVESCDVTEHGLRWLAALPKLKAVKAYKSGIKSGADLPSHLRVFADEGGYQHIDYDQPDRMLIFELDERLIAGHTQTDEISELDHHRRGNVYASTRAYAEAVEEYDKAIDELLHPQYHGCSLMAAGHDYRLFECYDSRAMALSALGKHAKALMDINKAVAICRTSSVARAHRGYTHFKLGQLELALDDLNRAIELKPNLSLAYEYRSEVFEAQGKIDLAAKDRDTSRHLRG